MAQNQRLTVGSRKGFTLLEVVVTVAVIAIIGIAAALILPGKKNSNDLTLTAAQVMASLREAQSRSVTELQGTSWGVHFDNSISGHPFYALYVGSYSPSSTVSYNPLPTDLGFVATTLPVGSSTNILFNQISGAAPSTTVSVYLRTNPSQVATVSINSVGVVTLATLGQGSGQGGQQASTPSASPSAGTYSSYQSVILSCGTPNPTIYYTTDGSTPTIGSSIYSSPISVTSNETVNAICAANGYTNSAQLSAAYTINLPQAATPIASPVAGTYTGAQSVSLSCSTPGSTMYYTTDGTTPTLGSTAYSTPINVAASETIKSICAASGYTNSAQLSAAYTINYPIASTPSASPAAGMYYAAQSVSLSCSTPGSTMYYTTNGTTPTHSSTVYSTPIGVTSTLTLNAICAASGYTDSAQSGNPYQIDQWTEPTAAATWPERSYANTVVFNGEIWIMGGEGTSYGNGCGEFCSDVWYSSDGVNWTEATAAAPWGPAADASTVVFNGKIWYMVGDTVWYSSDGVNWTEATAAAPWATSRQGRIDATALVYNNEMWIMGVWYHGSVCRGPCPIYFNNDVWYSSDGVNWTQATAAAPWSARALMGSVVYNNKMWIMGGTATFNTGFGDVWYSSDGANWTEATAAAPWPARYGFTALAYNNQMWVMGGTGSGSNLSDVWYSSDGANWTEETATSPWQKWFSTSAVFNNGMWIMGGTDPNSPDYSFSNSVWRFGP
jgi:prepilin-type N-terminal cleavage/methylation domain-containing protein